MTQFDVRRTSEGALVIDCQSNLLRHLNTRLVVPLLPVDQFEVVARRLNPLFTIGETDYVMYTQFAATLTVNQLGEVVMNLDADSLAIIGALDVLVTGV